MPTRFLSAQVIPAFLCVLSFGTLMSTSAARIVRGIKYSLRSDDMWDFAVLS